MEIKFDNLGVVLKLNDQLTIFDKEKIANDLGFDELQKKHCMCIVGNKEIGALCFVSWLENLKGKMKYEDFLKQYAQTNVIASGLNYTNHEYSKNEKGGVVDVLEFSSNNNTIISCLTCIDDVVYFGTISYGDKNMAQKNFLVEVMKGLRKI